MMTEKKPPTRRSVRDGKRSSGPSSTGPVMPRPSARPTTQSSQSATRRPAAPGQTKNTVEKSIRQKTKLRWPQVVFILLLLIIVALAGLFSWERWFRHDDLQDFQAEWTFVNGDVSTPVLIDEESIHFAQEIDYDYELNTRDKTITYTFGDLKGSGVYRFSPDRKTLVIAEDASGDWFVDLKVTLGFDDPLEGFDAEKTTLLTRNP